jgi:hypothetical protein
LDDPQPRILPPTIICLFSFIVFDQHLGPQLPINVLHKFHIADLHHAIVVTCQWDQTQVVLEAALLLRDDFGEVGEGFAALEFGVLDHT